jgi:hypothetical protein
MLLFSLRWLVVRVGIYYRVVQGARRIWGIRRICTGLSESVKVGDMGIGGR